MASFRYATIYGDSKPLLSEFKNDRGDFRSDLSQFLLRRSRRYCLRRALGQSRWRRGLWRHRGIGWPVCRSHRSCLCRRRSFYSTRTAVHFVASLANNRRGQIFRSWFLTSHVDRPKIAAWRQQLVLQLQNVSFLERPVQPITLISASRSLRARSNRSQVALGSSRARCTGSRGASCRAHTTARSREH